MRTSKIIRNTTETQIELELNLDGTGVYKIATPCGFLNHMLELFTRHGRFDLTINATADTHVDYHHLTEDIGIVLGRTFAEALGDMAGINRYGNFLLPMDETLVLVAIDISGRSALGYQAVIPTQKIGDFDTELVEEFFQGFTRGIGASVHVKQMAGTNSHHIVEAIFKGLARAMKEAVAIDERFKDQIPSTKGTIL